MNMESGGPGADMLDGQPEDDGTNPGTGDTSTVGGTTPDTSTVNPAGVVLTISGFKFSKVSVKAGSTVAIHNSDGVDHTVTIAAAGIDVPIGAGETASFMAPMTPGTYTLTCDLHLTMKGTLIVTG